MTPVSLPFWCLNSSGTKKLIIFVGVPRIELGLQAPHACVLPLYDIPQSTQCRRAPVASDRTLRDIARGVAPAADAPKVDELAFSSSDSTLAGEPGVAPRSYPLMAAVEQKPVTGAANPRDTTRMIIVGDSFFLGNHNIEGGASGANRDFLGYAVNWLLDESPMSPAGRCRPPSASPPAAGR